MVRAGNSKYWITSYHGKSNRSKTKGTRFEAVILRFKTMHARVETMHARVEMMLALLPW